MDHADLPIRVREQVVMMRRVRWTDNFPHRFDAEWDRHRQAQFYRSERQRRASRTAGANNRAPEEDVFVMAARARAESRRSLERRRLSTGYRWFGGSVGRKLEYRRPAKVYPGLISDQNPILRLLVSKTARAPNLLTGQHKAEVTGTDSKLLALDCPYVESLKPMRGILRVELDTNYPSWAALAAAIESCGVPAPNIAVGYVDETGQVWRPHLLWILAESVCFTAKGRWRPQSAWKNALRGLTAALLPIGADPGGIANPHRHKNPVSPLWDRQVFAAAPYALGQDKRSDGPAHAPLQPHLPTPREAAERLRQTEALRQTHALNQPAAARPDADHPDSAVAAQSNALFNRLSAFVRDRVVRHREEGDGNRQEFDAEIAAEALAMAPPGRKAEKAALAQGRGVAEWTWTHFQPRPPKAPPLTPELRQQRFAAGAIGAALAKRTGTLAAMVTAIRTFPSGGSRPTQAAVAEAIQKNVRTVRRHWAAALTTVEQDISPAYR